MLELNVTQLMVKTMNIALKIEYMSPSMFFSLITCNIVFFTS